MSCEDPGGFTYNRIRQKEERGRGISRQANDSVPENASTICELCDAAGDCWATTSENILITMEQENAAAEAEKTKGGSKKGKANGNAYGKKTSGKTRRSAFANPATPEESRLVVRGI